MDIMLSYTTSLWKQHKTRDSDTVSIYQVSSVQIVTDFNIELVNAKSNKKQREKSGGSS